MDMGRNSLMPCPGFGGPATDLDEWARINTDGIPRLKCIVSSIGNEDEPIVKASWAGRQAVR